MCSSDLVERERIIDIQQVKAGDALVGLPSSGVHSNGYSLVRRLLDPLPMDRDDWGLGAPLGEVLLRPTRIYVKQLLALRERYDLRGAAHITGGGFTGNVPRVLPPGLGARIDAGSWPVLPIFDLLRASGGLSDVEMYRTFNNGIGMVCVVPAEQADAFAAEAGGYRIGRVVEDPAQECVVA